MLTSTSKTLLFHCLTTANRIYFFVETLNKSLQHFSYSVVQVSYLLPITSHNGVTSILLDNFCKKNLGKYLWLLTIFCEAITMIEVYKKNSTQFRNWKWPFSHKLNAFIHRIWQHSAVSLFIWTKYELQGYMLQWTHFDLRNHSPKCVEKLWRIHAIILIYKKVMPMLKAPYKIIILYMNETKKIDQRASTSECRQKPSSGLKYKLNVYTSLLRK